MRMLNIIFIFILFLGSRPIFADDAPLFLPDFRKDCDRDGLYFNRGGVRTVSLTFKNYLGHTQTSQIQLKLVASNCVRNSESSSFLITKENGAKVRTLVIVDSVGDNEYKVSVSESDCMTKIIDFIKADQIAKGVVWTDGLSSALYINTRDEYCVKLGGMISNTLINVLKNMPN